MRDVAILGVGMTKFGELWDRSFREIGIEAGFQALVDAKLSSKDLGALYLGNMASGSLIDQEHIAPMILDYSGLGGHHLEAVRVVGGEPRALSHCIRATSPSEVAPMISWSSAAPKN